MQFVTWGPWAFIGTMLSQLPVVLLGWLLMRWPGERLQTRTQVRSLRAALILVPLSTFAWCVAWDPRWNGFTGRPGGPLSCTAKRSGTGFTTTSDCVEGVLLILFVALMAVRIIHATRPERRELVPVAVAATAFAGFAAVEAIAAPDRR